ncbi:plastid-lipid associated protein PAP [Actinidia rufa]|uniref:Plastid-lipid associated protein PAP n=1 Tax=Actinidia rufa TaxID=165716 RepID=A0A7J0E8H0_9ERIC|nr:plastid-lipid associated protein PAP [Actinidia rufa]
MVVDGFVLRRWIPELCRSFSGRVWPQEVALIPSLENQAHSSRIHGFSTSSLSISSLSKIVLPLSVFTFFGSDTFSSQRNSSNSQSQAKPHSPIGLQWSLRRRPSAATAPIESKSEIVASLKIKLLSVVSGLNRGLTASEDDLQQADAAAKKLEAVVGPVDLSVDLDKLQGRWKLIYSSAFSSRILGGSRPGPPTGRLLPITLGQLFLFLSGSCKVKIVFEKTTVKTRGNLSQLPPLEIPRIPDNLRPPSNTGSGEFEVTYMDSDTRMTRGDRGELRVFVIS